MPKKVPSAREARTRVSRSADETFRMARELAEGLTGDEVILLTGGLGVGKTVFAKGVAAGAGVADPDRVISPSFTLLNIYQGRYRVYHVDLYRLDREEDILGLGWEDFLGAGVVLVEWAEKLTFPVEGAIEVRIEVGPDDERRITVASSRAAPAW